MRQPFLFGEYDLTVDDKNRLLVPADIRKSINPEDHGDAFFLIVGINRVPWLYPQRYYERLISESVPADVLPAEDLLAFDQMNFAMASRLEWDSQGRVSIPQRTLRRTGLSRDVTLIGVRDHLELWNRSDWETRREQLLEQSADVMSKAKKARQEKRET